MNEINIVGRRIMETGISQYGNPYAKLDNGQTIYLDNSEMPEAEELLTAFGIPPDTEPFFRSQKITSEIRR